MMSPNDPKNCDKRRRRHCGSFAQRSFWRMMMMRLAIGSLFGLAAAAAGPPHYDVREPQIWPAASIQELYSSPNQILRTLSLDKNFDIYVQSGDQRRVRPSARLRDILDQAQRRFRRSLMATVPRESDNESIYPINPGNRQLWPLTGIRITIANISQDTLFHGIDESYELEIRPVLDNEPVVLLSSLTVFGALHGLQSLLQLFAFGWVEGEKQAGGTGAPIFILDNSPLLIQDKPEYPYRGLMIDSSRHFLPLSLILKNLDAMEMNKLNVLHWHVVDSQSWPYQSDRFPELSEKAAYCSECIYTKSEIDTVIQKAALRGIRVIPEFDVPGHTASITASHPEIMSTCNGVPHEPLDPTSQATYDFVTSLYDEVGELFPDSFVHVGGDEVSVECWKESKDVQEWMKQQNMTDESQLQQYFEDYLLSYLIRRSDNPRTPIVWQEVMDTSHKYPFQRRFPFGEYSNHDILLDVWKDETRREELWNATSSGYQTLVSSCWYLDHLGLDVPALYRCQIWDFDGDENYLYQNSTRQGLLQGGHSSMWGESVDEQNFFPRVWPRASTVAEQLWTAPNKTKDFYDKKGKQIMDSFLGRLDKFRCLMLAQGVPASPFQPGSCHSVMARAIRDSVRTE